MRVHHLDCFTMCPLGGSWLGGTGSIFNRAKLVAHCLLVEGSRGLILVDTGMGLMDAENPKTRFDLSFRVSANPVFSREICAIEQIKKLGFDPKDVRDIVVTHLDLDHAGGLVDFPDANVHVLEKEHAAATARTTWIERTRYVTKMWDHSPKWRMHGDGGDTWFGFDSVRALENDDVLLIPLHGHTRGHAAVAVRSPIAGTREWLLHAGDSYFHRDEIHATPASCPGGLAFYEAQIAMDDRLRRNNQKRLRDLVKERGHEVDVFCAHSPQEFDRLVAASRADVVDDRPTARDVAHDA
jgi:glyoxylase-like metal-dependent hydrolase (beta-lactamase superfamily II)